MPINSHDYTDTEAVNNSDEDDIANLVQDLAGGLDDKGDFEVSDGLDETDVDLEAINQLVIDNTQELYPGCKKFSKLHFLIRILHLKLLGGWTDKSFDMLLDLLMEAFPDGLALPKNFNEAKKVIKCLGLGYIKIDACENDCILFRKEYANCDACPTCERSRWKSKRRSLNGKRVHKVPCKVLRYFPIKRRLQRLFLSSKTASDMRWHDEERIQDGLLRHPADSPLWKDFDQKHPVFASDSRNIRLALATDGFNPFRSMNVSYSIWPVILIPYNFAPWLCMKQTNFIISLLIPGRRSPGSDIDVYFEPLIDDLLDMFVEGVRTYDSAKHEYFQLRAAIIWTISDYPGLGYIAACTTSGEVACIECHSYTCSLRLKQGTKNCYMGHRRFLGPNHPYRFDLDSFDGKVEDRPAPRPLSGEEVLLQTENMHTVHGKGCQHKKKAKKKEGEPTIIWKRRSIFLGFHIGRI